MSAIKPKPTIKKFATPSASGPSVLTLSKTQEKSKLTNPSNIIKTNDIQRPSEDKGISEAFKKAKATYSTTLQSKTPHTHPNASLQTPGMNSNSEIQIREATQNESIQPIALKSESFYNKHSQASEGYKIEGYVYSFSYFCLLIF